MASPLRTRSKVFNEGGTGDIVIGVQNSWYQGNLIGSQSLTLASKHRSHSTDTCTDRTHKRAKNRWKEGGPVSIVKHSRTVQVLDVNIRCKGTSVVHEYIGQMYPMLAGVIPADYAPHALALPSTLELNAYGTKGWKKFQPGRPDVSLAVFMAELRDLPKMLRQRVSEFRGFKGTGSGYLAWEFGWKALVRDLKSMYQLQRSIESKIHSIKVNNGKWLLRTGSVSKDEQSDTWETNLYGFSPIPPSDMWDPNSTHTVATGRLSRKVWFSGRFRYYIPEKELHTSKWRRKTIRKLYGLSITPEAAWELIPWSWLIDYFCNAGDIFANISGGGRYVDAVAKYAYIMCHTTRTLEQTSSFSDKNGQRYVAMLRDVNEHKVRVSATAFGFGMESDILSGSQLAILAALGLSKSW